MPRQKKIEIGIINIATDPHSPDIYKELLYDSVNNRQVINTRGQEGVILGEINPIERDNPLNGLYGTIYRFINLDLMGSWLDLKQVMPIEPEEDKPAVDIPDNLKPNLKTVYFVFYPIGHRLFFDCSMISPRYLRSFFIKLFSLEQYFTKYGQIFVNVETTEESIERIMSIQTLSSLDILVNRPNGDDQSGLEEKVLSRIKKQNISSWRNFYKGERSEGIEPDEETIAFMNVARSNGVINAIGYENEKRVEISTLEHPKIEKKFYDPKKANHLTALIDFSKSMLNQFIKK